MFRALHVVLVDTQIDRIAGFGDLTLTMCARALGQDFTSKFRKFVPKTFQKGDSLGLFIIPRHAFPKFEDYWGNHST